MHSNGDRFIPVSSVHGEYIIGSLDGPAQGEYIIGNLDGPTQGKYIIGNLGIKPISAIKKSKM